MSLITPSENRPSMVSISGGSNRQLFNDMNVILPQFQRQLIGKYGTEMALLWELMGSSIVEARTKTRSFEHYEGRRLRQHVNVNANVGSATAGASITVTLKSGDHYNGGTESSVRVGEDGQISSTGVWFSVTAIDKSVNSAHTITIKPVNSADKLASAGQTSTLLASDILLMKGNVYAGEKSTKMEGQSPIIDTISNTTTEVRDDFSITDRANAEEIKVGDQSFGWYYKHATTQLNKKLMHSIQDIVLEGRVADQAGTSVGTLGVIPRVLAAGGQVNYGVGSLSKTHFQELARYFTFQGAGTNFQYLYDIFQGQEIDNAIFGLYPNGAIEYDRNAPDYGFTSWKINDYIFKFKSYKGFSPESGYGAYPASGFTHYRKNFAVVIPEKLNIDAEGAQFPSMQIVYQEVKPGVKILTEETGLLADANKTTTAEKVLTALCYVGSRVFAANQFATVQGS